MLMLMSKCEPALRHGDVNVLRVKRRDAQLVICPIRDIERYFEVVRDTRVDLTRRYLFRPVTSDEGVKDTPLSSSAAESRLKGYLRK